MTDPAAPERRKPPAALLASNGIGGLVLAAVIWSGNDQADELANLARAQEQYIRTMTTELERMRHEISELKGQVYALTINKRGDSNGS